VGVLRFSIRQSAHLHLPVILENRLRCIVGHDKIQAIHRDQVMSLGIANRSPTSHVRAGIKIQRSDQANKQRIVALTQLIEASLPDMVSCRCIECPLMLDIQVGV
jgi:hypothetical protein